MTGEDRRPKSPAERLNLTGPKRVKAEKCLANAVYFESRSEPVRGQIAVAQVVMNRAFSGFYPNDVCGVVYQNAHRHLACQFTFACDGIADVVNDQESWERAKRISRETLDGKLWLPEIAKSTHYHASYVQPVLGARDEEARQDRAASLLSPAQMGRRRRGTVMGQRDLYGGRRGEDVTRSVVPEAAKRLSGSHERRSISISSATSRFGAECVIAPDDR